MSRPLAVTILVSFAILITLGAWAMAPPPPTGAPEPTTPPDLLQRIDKLEAAHQSSPPDRPTQQPPPPAQEPTIRRVHVDGQDLADLQGLLIWKFQFRLPDSHVATTAYIWQERWKRGEDAPEYELLETASGQWTKNDLVIKLPADEKDRLFIRIDQISDLSAPRENPILPASPIGWATLDSQSLKMGEAVHLITLTHNDTGTMRTGLRDVHRDNDETVYIKAGFLQGSYVAFDADKWISHAGPSDKADPRGGELPKTK